jgi:hypothetical protein
MKRGGFGTSVAPTDDLRRWPLFTEPAAAAPTTAATTEAGAALKQSRPERWGRRMLGRRGRRAEEQALRGVVEERERDWNEWQMGKLREYKRDSAVKKRKTNRKKNRGKFPPNGTKF